MSFLPQQGNSISNSFLYLIWTYYEYVRLNKKSLHFLDEKLSLVCFHFTLLARKFFTLWNKFQNSFPFFIFCSRLHDGAILDFVCSGGLIIRFNAKLIQQVSKTLINTDFRLKQCKRAQKASIRVNHIERKFIQTEWFLSLTGISYDHDSFPCILKNLSRGFRNTSYYLATGKNHIQLWAAPKIEISAQDRKESFTTLSYTSTAFLEYQ